MTLLLLFTGLARAQVVASQSEFAQFEQMARDWVQPALASVTGPDGGGALRPEVLFGSLDSRLKLTPCTHIEPYLPPGTRLCGSRIGFS